MSLLASDAEELSSSSYDPTLLPSAQPSTASTGIDTELFHVLSKAMEELSFEWSPPEEPTRSRLDEWFLPGRHHAPRQWASPFFPEVHDEISRFWHTPYLGHRCASSSSALKMAAKKRGTTDSLPWMSHWPHIFARPRTSIGRQRSPTHPSRVGQLQL